VPSNSPYISILRFQSFSFDTTAVSWVARAHSKFMVRISFTQFQLRMRVSKQARIEFIPCPHETVGSFILIILICLCVHRLYPAFAPLCNVQAVLGSGSSRSALRSLAHPRWMSASASSIGLPHQVTIDAGSFIRGLSDDPACLPTVPLPPVSAASHV
jgi:hypothetical protein